MNNLPEKIVDSLVKPIENIAVPLSVDIGKTIDDLWFLAMGGISHCVDKKRIKYAFALEEFRKNLVNKINAIPAERRVEPDTQMTCQALEDAKFCAENEEIREMFSSLISSLMDSQMQNYVHISYSSILRQMTSPDALFFKKFINVFELPICNFILEDIETHTFTTILDNAYFENIDASINCAYSNSVMVSSLERLGLIHLTFQSYFTDEKIYSVYENSNIIKAFQSQYNSDKKSATIQRGRVYLTSIGTNLLKVCCPNSNS